MPSNIYTAVEVDDLLARLEARITALEATPAPSPPPPSGDPVPTGVPGVWTLKFRDEFDGAALDLTKWEPYWYTEGHSLNNVSVRAANVAVTGGNLILTLASSISGACVTTNPKGIAGHGFQYQGPSVVEARCWFPGDGSHLYNWPAFWVETDAGGNAEIDIAEVLEPNGGSLTINYHGNGIDSNSGPIPGYWGDAWHTFTCHRKASTADIYWDGVLKRTVSTNDNNVAQYILFNIGRGMGPTVIGATGQFKVDYVRVWQ